MFLNRFLYFEISKIRIKLLLYLDWERTSQHPINTRDSAVAALSDAQFIAPLVHTGDLLSPPPIQMGQEKTGPKCYFYVFDYQTKDGDYPQVNESIVS